MKIRSLQFKVLLLMACGLAMVLAVSLGALSRVYGSIQELDRISREDFETQQAVLRTALAFKQQVQEWKDTLLRGSDPAELDKHWKQFAEREKDVAESAQEARTSTRHEEVSGPLVKFIAGHKAAGAKYREAFEAFKEAKFEPRVADKAVSGLEKPLSQALNDIENTATEFGAKATAEAVKRAETGYRWAIVGTVVALVGTLVALWVFFRRSVLAPIGSAARFAERVAKGDLSGAITARSQDEAGQLVTALARMSASLAEVVSKVRVAANAVATASSQVAAGTTDLSQRTEEQASALEQTAASMEELSSTVRQNADNAKEADELARNAARRAEQGGTEVGRAVATMSEISRSAQRIADITSVIDAIAFQTNILALNAAVEAARAGEQGRGFAVVAAEVRSLAQRSAQAAKEIKDLIGHSVIEVKSGTAQVEQAGGTIQALVSDVKRVSGLMESIAEASAEQSRGVQQVNKTVTQMDKVVQENASAVQQSAAAAQGMRQQAELLVEAVSAFVLESTAASRSSFQARQETTIAHRAGPGLEDHAPRAAQPVAKLAAASAVASDDWEEF